MTALVLVFVLFLIAALASAEKSPPRKALPAPCDVPCLEAKNAALQRLAVKRLKLLSAREHRIVRLMKRLRRDQAHSGARQGRTSRTGRESSPRAVICSVFGAHCSEALRVAWCESRMNIWATNGQYVNLFQMGYNERRQYGWHVAGSPAIVAAHAAYNYFRAAGYSWGPWSCKP